MNTAMMITKHLKNQQDFSAYRCVKIILNNHIQKRARDRETNIVLKERSAQLLLLLLLLLHDKATLSLSITKNISQNIFQFQGTHENIFLPCLSFKISCFLKITA